MQPSDEIATEQSRSSEWQELRGHVQHQTVEVLRLIAILVQDAVILVAGFIAEYAYEHWLHSDHPFFQLAVSLSSAFFLLLYVITVTVHVVQYVRGQVGATKVTWLGDKLPWAIIGGGVIAAAVAFTVPSFRSADVAPAKSIRFSIPPPPNSNYSQVGTIALSPDGTQMAFAAYKEGKQLLWVRSLDSLEAKPLPGTEGASRPFWSPDSRFLGFFADIKLKKIEVAGGPPQILADASAGITGGTWSREGIIVFAGPSSGGSGQPLFHVSAAGGEATATTVVDTSRESRHGSPFFLPDGRHFLFSISSGRPEIQGIYVGSLDSKEKTRVLGEYSNAAYVPPGYLLFVRQGTLMAQPFDAKKLQLTGEPFSVAEDVYFNALNGEGAFSVSENGALSYLNGSGDETRLTWFDRSGKELGQVGQPGGYSNPKLSPDGKQVAVEQFASNNRDIWLLEAGRGVATRFTFHPGPDIEPLWSPDGSRVAIASNRDGQFELYQKLTAGSSEEELLYRSTQPIAPFDWSSDGRYLVYNVPVTPAQLWVLPLAGDPSTGTGQGRKPFLFEKTDFVNTQAQISPDGRWIAYLSNESGRDEVYIQSFPKAGTKRQVTANGGVQPRWRRDGKELFYIGMDQMLMAVAVKGEASLEIGGPTP
ncbi:MAG: PD40 domain-containing protein, partial [Acidobacteria bacterium]|nr:PD40 domain-containing protein [Acidobacteriota bacterium]